MATERTKFHPELGDGDATATELNGDGRDDSSPPENASSTLSLLHKPRVPDNHILESTPHFLPQNPSPKRLAPP